MAATTRSADRILSDRAEIARRYLRGETQGDHSKIFVSDSDINR